MPACWLTPALAGPCHGNGMHAGPRAVGPKPAMAIITVPSLKIANKAWPIAVSLKGRAYGPILLIWAQGHAIAVAIVTALIVKAFSRKAMLLM